MNLEKQNIFPVNSISDLEQVVEKTNPKSIMLVRSHWGSVDKNAELKKHLDKTFSKSKDSLEVRKVDVHIYYPKN